MSIRIHQLAKQIGLDNKELIDLLKERGFEVKSASSTVDNISAEALIEEFSDAGASSNVAAPRQDVPEKLPEPPAPAAPRGPAVFVRTREEIDREKQEAEAASQVQAAQKADEAAQRAEAEKKEAEREAARRVASIPAPVTPKNAPGAFAPPRGPGAAVPPRTASSAFLSSNSPASFSPPRQAPASQPGFVRPAASAPEKTAPAPTSAPAAAAPKSPTPVSSERKEAPKSAPAATPPPVRPSPASAPGSFSPPPLNKAPSPAGPRPMTPPGSAASATSGDGKEAESAPAGERKLRQVTMKPPVVLRDLAELLGVKSFRLIAEFMEMGIFASMNGAVDEAVAKKVAENHGVLLEIRHRGDFIAPKVEKVKKPDEDDEKFLKPRPPVICILGHVDHGKTTLTDAIRKANVVADEAGGITQHIGAYQVEHAGHTLTVLDTPGHAAFSAMREMGANVTDISILVVAADDGFMPQTDEALKFARKAQSAVVVAINKIDAKGANIDRVKTQMQDRGIAPEDWGGETLCAPISALKGDGISSLLESVILQAEIMELRANPDAKPSGVIIESQVEQGRGPSATVIVDKGTLKVGETLVCGMTYCRVRAMMDENGKPVKSAPPSTPVRLLGWSDAPDVGARFETAKSERDAKKLVEERIHEYKLEVNQRATASTSAATIDDLFAAIQNQSKKTYRVILKSDVSGSLAAIRTSLLEIKSDKIDLKIIAGSVGPITKADVVLASTAKAAIIGFNVKIENGVQGLAKHHGVDIYHHSIIYEIIDLVKDAMADLLDPELRERKVGSAEVRQVFSIGRGQVAGCMVLDGNISRNAKARLVRKGTVIAEAKLDTLRRFKDDVSEVRAGYECGIHLFNVNTYEEGDIIECFEVEKLRASL